MRLTVAATLIMFVSSIGIPQLIAKWEAETKKTRDATPQPGTPQQSGTPATLPAVTPIPSAKPPIQHSNIAALSTKKEGKRESAAMAFRDNRYVPSLDVMFDSGGTAPAFNLINRGTANLYLWGDKFGDYPISIDKVPTTITPLGGAYHIWATEALKVLNENLPKDGEIRMPLSFYVSTDDGKKHVLHYSLWVVRKDGKIHIETQNHGTTDEEFKQQ